MSIKDKPKLFLVYFEKKISDNNSSDPHKLKQIIIELINFLNKVADNTISTMDKGFHNNCVKYLNNIHKKYLKLYRHLKIFYIKYIQKTSNNYTLIPLITEASIEERKLLIDEILKYQVLFDIYNCYLLLLFIFHASVLIKLASNNITDISIEKTTKFLYAFPGLLNSLEPNSVITHKIIFSDFETLLTTLGYTNNITFSTLLVKITNNSQQVPPPQPTAAAGIGLGPGGPGAGPGGPGTVLATPPAAAAGIGPGAGPGGPGTVLADGGPGAGGPVIIYSSPVGLGPEAGLGPGAGPGAGPGGPGAGPGGPGTVLATPPGAVALPEGAGAGLEPRPVSPSPSPSPPPPPPRLPPPPAPAPVDGGPAPVDGGPGAGLGPGAILLPRPVPPQPPRAEELFVLPVSPVSPADGGPAPVDGGPPSPPPPPPRVSLLHYITEASKMLENNLIEIFIDPKSNVVSFPLDKAIKNDALALDSRKAKGENYHLEMLNLVLGRGYFIVYNLKDIASKDNAIFLYIFYKIREKYFYIKFKYLQFYGKFYFLNNRQELIQINLTDIPNDTIILTYQDSDNGFYIYQKQGSNISKITYRILQLHHEHIVSDKLMDQINAQLQIPEPPPQPAAPQPAAPQPAAPQPAAPQPAAQATIDDVIGIILNDDSKLYSYDSGNNCILFGEHKYPIKYVFYNNGLYTFSRDNKIITLYHANILNDTVVIQVIFNANDQRYYIYVVLFTNNHLIRDDARINWKISKYKVSNEIFSRTHGKLFIGGVNEPFKDFKNLPKILQFAYYLDKIKPFLSEVNTTYDNLDSVKSAPLSRNPIGFDNEGTILINRSRKSLVYWQRTFNNIVNKLKNNSKISSKEIDIFNSIENSVKSVKIKPDDTKREDKRKALLIYIKATKDELEKQDIKFKDENIINTNKIILDFSKVANVFKLILVGLTVLSIIIYIIVLIISIYNLFNLLIKIIGNIIYLFYNTALTHKDTLSYAAKNIIKCTKDNYSDDIFNVLNEQLTALSVFNTNIYIIYIIFGYIILYLLYFIYSLIFSKFYIFKGDIKDIDPNFTLLTVIAIIFICSFVHLLIYKFLFKTICLNKFKDINQNETNTDNKFKTYLSKFKDNNEPSENTKFYNLLTDSTKKDEIDAKFQNMVLELQEDTNSNLGKYILIYNLYIYFQDYLYINDKKKELIKAKFDEMMKGGDDTKTSFISFMDLNERRLIKSYHQELPFYKQIPSDKFEYFKIIDADIGDLLNDVNKSIITYAGTFYPFLFTCIYILIICIYNIITTYIILKHISDNKEEQIFPQFIYRIADKIIDIVNKIYNLFNN
jgi:hypothetical protein